MVRLDVDKALFTIITVPDNQSLIIRVSNDQNVNYQLVH